MGSMTGWSGLKFPFQFENGKPATSVATVETNDYSHISESIQQIIGVFVGERPFSKDVGLRSRLVFKNYSEELLPYYESIVKEAIENSEKRISVDVVKADSSRIKEGVIVFKIRWTLLKYNVPHITEAYVKI